MKSVLLILVMSKLFISCDYSDNDNDLAVWISAVSAGDYVDLYANPISSVNRGYINFQAEPSHIRHDSDYRCEWRLECSDGTSGDLGSPACWAGYSISALDSNKTCTIRLEVDKLGSHDRGRTYGRFRVE